MGRYEGKALGVEKRLKKPKTLGMGGCVRLVGARNFGATRQLPTTRAGAHLRTPLEKCFPSPSLAERLFWLLSVFCSKL